MWKKEKLIKSLLKFKLFLCSIVGIFFVAFVMFLVESIFLTRSFKIENIIFAFITAIVVIILFRISYKNFNRKNLSLSRLTNSIHMNWTRRQSQHELIGNMYSDLNQIMNYAKRKNIKELNTKTHTVLIKCILREYCKIQRSDLQTILDVSKIKKIKYDKFELKYVGKRYNALKTRNTSLTVHQQIEKDEFYIIKIFIREVEMHKK